MLVPKVLKRGVKIDEHIKHKKEEVKNRGLSTNNNRQGPPIASSINRIEDSLDSVKLFSIYADYQSAFENNDASGDAREYHLENELYKNVEIEATTESNVRFSFGANGTYLGKQPHSTSGTNPTGNAKYNKKLREALLTSGKEKLTEVMTKNIKARLKAEGIKGRNATPIVNEEIKRVTDFLDYMNDMFVSMATDDIYTFVGFNDVVNQSIRVRKNAKGEITGVSMSAMIKNGEYPVNFDFITLFCSRFTNSAVHLYSAV